MDRYDAIIIGTGQSGPALARRLAKAGQKVAVVERKFFGGTCVNTGCTPTKTLVASAYAAHVARRAADYGVTISGPIEVDMKAVKARKDAVALASRQYVERSLKTLDGCTVYEGHAQLVAANKVAVGDSVLMGNRIFINVGGRALVPPIPGLNDVPYLTMIDDGYRFPSAASRRAWRQLHRAGIRADVSPIRKRGHGHRTRAALGRT